MSSSPQWLQLLRWLNTPDVTQPPGLGARVMTVEKLASRLQVTDMVAARVVLELHTALMTTELGVSETRGKRRHS